MRRKPDVPPTSDTVEHLGWNIQRGAHLTEVCDWINRRAHETGKKPDVLTLQEVQPGQGDEIAARVGMDYYPAPDDGRSKNRNAIVLNPDGAFVHDPDWEQHWTGVWHAPATAMVALRLPDGELSERRLFLGSEHSCYWNPAYRETEARYYSTLAKDLRLMILQGDFNGWTVGRAPTSLDRVEDQAYAQNRAVLGPDGEFRPDVQADRLLTSNGFVDLGRYSATTLGIEGADAPTTGHGPDKDRQRIPDTDRPKNLSAIDRTYATKELLPALVHASSIDTPEVRTYADHLPVGSTWSYRGLVEVMSRSVRLVYH